MEGWDFLRRVAIPQRRVLQDLRHERRLDVGEGEAHPTLVQLAVETAEQRARRRVGALHRANVEEDEPHVGEAGGGV